VLAVDNLTVDSSLVTALGKRQWWLFLQPSFDSFLAEPPLTADLLTGNPSLLQQCVDRRLGNSEKGGQFLSAQDFLLLRIHQWFLSAARRKNPLLFGDAHFRSYPNGN
jgi:hypothetical protein